MLQLLSKKQERQSQKEVDKFLLSLDWQTKYDIKRLLEPLFKSIDCEHDWIDLDSYENELPKNSLLCRNCNLIKAKKNE